MGWRDLVDVGRDLSAPAGVRGGWGLIGSLAHGRAFFPRTNRPPPPLVLPPWQTKRGFLMKRGNGQFSKAFKRRFFRLRDHFLDYYGDDSNVGTSKPIETGPASLARMHDLFCQEALPSPRFLPTPALALPTDHRTRTPARCDRRRRLPCWGRLSCRRKPRWRWRSRICFRRSSLCLPSAPPATGPTSSRPTPCSRWRTGSRYPALLSAEAGAVPLRWVMGERG